ncbi:MAG: MFS transporter [Burkholderiales bacterium]
MLRSTSAGGTQAPPERMSALELRASTSLASLFALRMLGLFLILPVFAIHASGVPGGDNHTLVGIALGIYGITQGLLQIPFGMASDRFGRKRVIVFGLVIFVIGSFVAAASSDLYVTILGRALQGAGAISAAVVAMIADLTREQHRTKAMALVGASIGLTFALSLVLAPMLYALIGMGGIFALTGVLAIGGILITLFVVPHETAHAENTGREVRAGTLSEVLRNPELLRLNVGVFALHAMHLALFVVVPLALVEQAGLPIAEHWKLYLPVVLISFALMMPPIMAAERRGKTKAVFLAAIVAMVLVLAGFAWGGHGTYRMAGLLLVFFVAFNILEATMPSLVTKLAPASARGTAIGVFNTTQALGYGVGGAGGGWVMQHYGANGVFVFGIALVALWLVIALPMRSPPTHGTASAGKA